MLSAISDGKMYTAGFIPDAKARSYQCPDPQCGKSVHHVAAHLRAGHELVTEHFRHPQETSHPLRKRSAMQGQALEFLLERLQCQPSREVSTDRSFRTSRGELATDLYVREHFPSGRYIDTVVQVEDNEFNFNEHLALARSLSSQGVYLMTVLCAQGKQNPQGYFYRTEWRNTKTAVKELRKNENALYDASGMNIYYDSDEKEMLLVRFSEYIETARVPVRNRRGEIVKDVGEVTEFKLKKVPQVKRVVSGPFQFQRVELAGARLVAFPKSPLEEQLQTYAAGYDGGYDTKYDQEERLAIMLDSLSEGGRKILSRKYAEEMGGYAEG